MAENNKISFDHQMFSSENFGYNRDLFIVCSSAGRVMYASGALKLLLGEDFSGRNLNDFIDDRLAATIISKAHDAESYMFDCNMCGKLLRCASEPCDDRIAIDMFPINAEDTGYSDCHMIEYASAEINKMLAVMFMSLDTIKLDEGKAGAALASINQNMFKLFRLTRNMEACARFNDGTLRLCPTDGDLAGFCRDLCKKAAVVIEHEEMELSVSIPETIIAARFDREKIERIVLNLLSNAVFSSRKGDVIRFSLTERETCYAITVQDHRTEMDIEEVGRMLNGKNGEAVSRMGFGMLVVRAFAQLHGGGLVISSSQGKSGIAACATLPKNIENEIASLSSTNIDYAGNFDHIMLEFSEAAGRDFYDLCKKK